MGSPFVSLSLPAAVPAVAGVPPLLVAPISVGAPPLATADAAGIPSLFGPLQWGIFSAGGGAILPIDSTASVQYQRRYNISDYPQEQGSFQSYNKVQEPFRGKIGVLIQATRFAFLNQVEQACASLALVSIVMPEVTYPSANLISYSYRRTSQNGTSMILVEVEVEEVRFTGTTQLSSTAAQQPLTPTNQTGSPNGQSPENGGTVQPVDTTGTTSTPAPPIQNSQPNAVTTPNVPPSFVPETFGSPDVPNSGPVPNPAAGFTSNQNSAISSLGTAAEASGIVAFPVDPNGNVIVTPAVPLISPGF